MAGFKIRPTSAGLHIRPTRPSALLLEAPTIAKISKLGITPGVRAERCRRRQRRSAGTDATALLRLAMRAGLAKVLRSKCHLYSRCNGLESILLKCAYWRVL